jgi:hypothetical protein
VVNNKDKQLFREADIRTLAYELFITFPGLNAANCFTAAENFQRLSDERVKSIEEAEDEQP